MHITVNFRPRLVKIEGFFFIREVYDIPTKPSKGLSTIRNVKSERKDNFVKKGALRGGNEI